MSNLKSVQSIARSIESKAAHAALFNLGDDRIMEHLAVNPSISKEMWDKLLVGSKVDTACNLAVRAAGDTEISLLLKDRRVGVKTKVFYMGAPGCSEELAEQIVSSSWFNHDYANAWLGSYDLGCPVPQNVLRRVADLARGYGLMRVMTYTDLFDIEEVKSRFLSFGYYYAFSQSRAILDFKSSIVDELSYSPSHWVLHNLVSCRHLFLEDSQMRILQSVMRCSIRKVDKARILLALAQNPNCHIEVLRAMLKVKSQAKSFVDLRETVKELIKIREKDGVVVEDWANLSNPVHRKVVDEYITAASERASWYPSISGYVRDTYKPRHYIAYQYRNALQGVRSNPYEIMFSATDGRHGEVVSSDEIAQYASYKIEKLGERGWSTFFSLFLDWKMSLGELIDTTLSISE